MDREGNAAGDAIALTLIEAGVLALLLALPLALVLPGWSLAVPVLLLCAGLAWLRGGAARPGVGMTFAVGGFVVSALLSIIFSSAPRLSLEASMMLPIGLLLFLAVPNLARRDGAFTRLAIVCAAVLGLLCVDAIAQRWAGQSFITGAPLHGGDGGGRGTGGRASASLPHPNDLTLLPLLLALAIPTLHAARRRALALAGPPALALLATVGVALSQSRAAALGLCVALAMLLLLARSRAMLAALGAALAALALIVVLEGGGGIIGRLLATDPNDPGGRLGLWLVALEMFRESPLVGQGAHVFGEFYPAYLDRVALPAGYAPELRRVPWPHNLYLEMLAERGAMGLIAFATLVAVTVRGLWHGAQRAANDELRAVSRGALAALAAFLAMALFELTFFKDWVTLMFWLMAGLAAASASVIPAQAVAAGDQRGQSAPMDVAGGPPARA